MDHAYRMEDLRLTCVNLARLRQDFAVRADGFEKVEYALPAADLAPLAATYGALEPEALLWAVCVIVQFYQERAPCWPRPMASPIPWSWTA